MFPVQDLDHHVLVIMHLLIQDLFIFLEKTVSFFTQFEVLWLSYLRLYLMCNFPLGEIPCYI